MLLLPIGRDESTIQRHAWVSYTIIALNVLVFMVMGVVERSSRMSELDRSGNAVLRYLFDHPYLEVPPSIAPILRDELKTAIASQRANVDRPSLEKTSAEQAELDELAEGFIRIYSGLPSVRYAYVPAHGSLLTMFTSLFLHSGFMHLFGNMLFFFLSGPFVEDVFGRPVFSVLYLTGGLAAAAFFGMRHPASMIPLVGASGAIAAVMGAYLVRFLRSRIEFIFVPFLIRPTFNFRFFVPAFVVLPLWFLQQFWEMSTEAGGAGVAFSAHVAGFVWGVAIALAVKSSKFEEKYVQPVVEKETSWKIDPRLDAAMKARTFGDNATARKELGEVLRKDPGNIEALTLSVEAARDDGDASAVDVIATRLLNRLMEEKLNEAAAELARDLTSDRYLTLPRFTARAAALAERLGDRDWAILLFEKVCATDDGSVGNVASLVRLATLLKIRGDVREARAVLERARAHPSCSAEWAPTIDAKLAQWS